MDYSKYEKIFASNKREIEELERDSSLTKDEKKSKIDFLKAQNTNIENYINDVKDVEYEINSIKTELKSLENQIETLKSDSTLTSEEREEKIAELKKKSDSFKKELKKQENRMDESAKNLRKNAHGKFRNVVSSLIGQYDKKIHNFVYGDDGVKLFGKSWLGKILSWEKHEIRTRDRYTNPGFLKYVATRAIGIGAVALLIPTMPAALASFATIATIGYGANAVGTAISTIVNKRRYGGPILEKKYEIKKGGFLNRIKQSIFEFKKSRRLVSNNVYENTMISTSSATTVAPSKDEKEEKTDSLEDKKNNLAEIHVNNIKNQINFAFNNIGALGMEELRKIVTMSSGVFDRLSNEDKKKVFALRDRHNELYRAAEEKTASKGLAVPTEEDLKRKNDDTDSKKELKTTESTPVILRNPSEEDLKRKVTDTNSKKIPTLMHGRKVANDVDKNVSSEEKLSFGQNYAEAIRTIVSSHSTISEKEKADKIIKDVERYRGHVQMVKDLKEFRAMITDIRNKYLNAKTEEERYIYRKQLEDARAYCSEEVEKYGIELDENKRSSRR